MPIRVAMVNYLNSKPFEFGLLQTKSLSNFDIITATPAECADLFKSGRADISLIPLGALTDIDDYRIISDYCIGCEGAVRTVSVFSNHDIRQCRKIYLDNHSRTSFLLTKILMSQYMHLDMTYQPANVADVLPQEDEAVLMIGDKVFEYEKKFTYQYDLGVMWKEWTGLPFVFAIWIAKKDTPESAESLLNTALKYGIDHLDDIIKQQSSDNLDLYYYFKHNIQYDMDDSKKKGLQLFLDKVRHYNLISSQ
ncbi:MAG: menaquinone biosynthesis protein [Saprospiraceae bacterium]|nr:menaquinone biosynthesis protein [Saprospiraceae bacterium]